MPIIFENNEVQVVETITTNGRTVQVIDKPGSPGFNREQLFSKARQALTANATYLALATPTAAQTTAQAKALTRQVNALIRLMLGALADVSGT